MEAASQPRPFSFGRIDFITVFGTPYLTCGAFYLTKQYNISTLFLFSSEEIMGCIDGIINRKREP